MIDPFEQLIQELSHHLDVPLHLQEKDSCAILVNELLVVQIELTKDLQKVLLGSHLGEVAPGKYREELLKEALKYNHRNYPDLGILGFEPSSKQLALFDTIGLDKLNGEILAAYFPIFVERAKLWQEALRKGSYPSMIHPAFSEPNLLLR